MSKYRTYAASAVRLAKRTTDPADKTAMLDIAQGWLDLAARTESGKTIVKSAPTLLEQPEGEEKPSLPN